MTIAAWLLQYSSFDGSGPPEVQQGRAPPTAAGCGRGGVSLGSAVVIAEQGHLFGSGALWMFLSASSNQLQYYRPCIICDSFSINQKPCWVLGTSLWSHLTLPE